ASAGRVKLFSPTSLQPHLLDRDSRERFPDGLEYYSPWQRGGMPRRYLRAIGFRKLSARPRHHAQYTEAMEICRLDPGVDPPLIPPVLLTANVMRRAVMEKAKRHGPLIADLTAHRPRLDKAQMVRMRRSAAANEAWKRCNEVPSSLNRFVIGTGKCE